MCNESITISSEKHTETRKIIIEFKDMNELYESIINKYGTVTHYLPMINSYVVEVPKQYVAKLKKLDNVMSVSEDTHVTAQMNNGRRAVNADSVHKAGLSGKGVTIAFLDTGIASISDFTHPKNRILAFKDFINKRDAAYDDNGHGTHVAGIASGNGFLSNGKYCGIAHEAAIVSVKVLDKNGQGNCISALEGIQWVLDNMDRYNIKILNLSIGTAETDLNDPLAKAVNAAWNKGIVVTAASGNNGPNKRTVTSPGTSKKIITVGASDDNI